MNGAGTPISGITTDIDGDTRNASTPDIGADEFTPAANDAGITMIVNPNGVYCASVSTGIKVAISNFGSNALSTCTVNYHVTGAATYAGTYTYSPSTALASGASDTVVIGSYTFVSGT